MKVIKRIYKWIIIAIILQVILLSYFNFVYLPNRGSVKATMYETAEEKIINKSLRLPSEAEGVAVSFNGLFAAYKKDDKIIIVDTNKKKEVKTLSAEDGKFNYYRWLPDRDLLIYSIESTSGDNGRVEVLTYDVGAGLDRNYPKITKLKKDSEVIDIELSPLTNVIYIMIKTSESQIKVYKFDINDAKSFIMNTDTNAIFKETLYSDYLVYQNDNGRIVARSGKSGKNKYLSSSKDSTVLLYSDADDNIYKGELNDDKKIINIQYRKLDQSEWKQIELDSPVLTSDIFIAPNGSVYIAATQENCIYKVGSKTKVSYKGNLLEVLDDYVVSRDGDWLNISAIE